MRLIDAAAISPVDGVDASTRYAMLRAIMLHIRRALSRQLHAPLRAYARFSRQRPAKDAGAIISIARRLLMPALRWPRRTRVGGRLPPS